MFWDQTSISGGEGDAYGVDEAERPGDHSSRPYTQFLAHFVAASEFIQSQNMICS